MSRAQYSQLIKENRGKYAYTSDALSVAQLFELVKTYDNNYPAGKEVNPCMLEEYTENGVRKTRPKIFYHGTLKGTIGSLEQNRLSSVHGLANGERRTFRPWR